MESFNDDKSDEVKQINEKVNKDKHEYCCRRCRVRLFIDDDLMAHTPKVLTKTKNNSNSTDKKRHVHKTTFKYGRDLPSNDEVDKVGLEQDNNIKKEENEQMQTSKLCTSYFLDPDKCTWVAAESRTIAQANNANQTNYMEYEGSNKKTKLGEVLPDTIYCKQCRNKVGTQCWNGAQCSCGAWVTPAFKVNAKAVDKLSMR